MSYGPVLQELLQSVSAPTLGQPPGPPSAPAPPYDAANDPEWKPYLEHPHALRNFLNMSSAKDREALLKRFHENYEALPDHHKKAYNKPPEPQAGPKPGPPATPPAAIVPPPIA